MAVLREQLGEIAHVDHHAHSLLSEEPADLDAFRRLFAETTDPRQLPHVATTITYRRAMARLAAELGLDGDDEAAVFAARRASDPRSWATELFGAVPARCLLVDEGYPPADASLTTADLGALAGCPAHPILRIESLGAQDGSYGDDALEAISRARADGYAGLKTIVCYRGGLDLDALPAARRTGLERALEANASTGDPLPVQVHVGFGDPDLDLPRARPGHLKPLVERHPDTAFVLLHNYPFIREAGWMAWVYANVFMDVSLTIPHVGRPAEMVAQALELCPTTKLLYASDSVYTPELYVLASGWHRDALAEVLGEQLPGADALAAARCILADNAAELYRL